MHIEIKKYHDFIEVADEAISEFTREVDGKTVPMWSPEEIKEIVMGQVREYSFHSWVCLFHLLYTFLKKANAVYVGRI
jgi:hypothetical protein